MNIASTNLINPNALNAFAMLNRAKQSAKTEIMPQAMPAPAVGSNDDAATTRTPSIGCGEPCQGGTPASPPSLEKPNHHSITIEGFQKAWGSGGTDYDLNGDGTVNIDDLVQFIAGLGVPAPNPAISSLTTTTAPPTADPATTDQSPHPSTGAPPVPSISIDGFDKAWGSNSSDYDLNGDGTVDMDDLVQYITSLPVPPPPAPPGAPMSVPVGDDLQPKPMAGPVPAPSAGATQPPLTLDGLLAAWNNSTGEASRAHSAYDLNGDKQVNMDGLTALVNGLTSSLPQQANGSRADATRSPAAATNAKKTDQLVAALTSRLDKLGFANQPPANIRDLIDAMNLSPADSNAAIRRLQQQYPKGLGINLVG